MTKNKTVPQGYILIDGPVEEFLASPNLHLNEEQTSEVRRHHQELIPVVLALKMPIKIKEQTFLAVFLASEDVVYLPPSVIKFTD